MCGFGLGIKNKMRTERFLGGRVSKARIAYAGRDKKP